MGKEQHIQSDHYKLARQGRLGRSTLFLQVHRHVVDLCPECRRAWDLLGEGRSRVEALLAEAGGEGATQPALHPHPTAYSWHVRRLEREMALLADARRTATRRCWELVDKKPKARAPRVERAWRRFRSRADAEYLLDKARQRLGEDPGDAHSLAEVALLVARRSPGPAESPWRTEIEARIALCRADALRRTGDGDAAQQLFARIRRDLVGAHLESPYVLAEAAELEAGLHLDAGRTAEAHRMLELATAVARTAGDRRFEARTLVRRGRLYAAGEEEGRRALACFRFAAAVLGDGRMQDDLRRPAVDGQLATLCDMERHGEAADLLERHLDLYDRWDHLMAGAVVRHHQGRIALGRGRLDTAVRRLREARETFAEGRRLREGLLATADLALAHAARGEDRELDALARTLAPALRSRRLSRSARAALGRLAEAMEERSLSARRVEAVRRALLRDALRDPVHPLLPPIP